MSSMGCKDIGAQLKPACDACILVAAVEVVSQSAPYVVES